MARNGSRAGWALAGLFALALSCTPALSGHAIGSERLPTLAVVLDATHVIAASLWLGAMFLLAASLSVAQRSGDGATGSALVDAFSPLALIAAGTVAVTGLGSSYLHLGAVSDLWRSRYGRTLLLKLAAVAAMIGAGWLNWRRNGPALRNSGQLQPMRRAVRLELAIGMLVLVATAVLVATPPPGSE
jgi:copper transport protein